MEAPNITGHRRRREDLPPLAMYPPPAPIGPLVPPMIEDEGIHASSGGGSGVPPSQTVEFHGFFGSRSNPVKPLPFKPFSK